MIWGILWALVVIAFLVFIFRRAGRLFLAWVLGLAAVIGVAFLQNALERSSSYGRFVDAASRVGRGILIVSVIVLVADLVAMTLYTIRHGKTDAKQGMVVREGSMLGASPDGQARPGASKLKILYSRSDSVSMESLLDGTATSGERLVALGIAVLFASFFLVFVGVGLILSRRLILGLLFPILPGFFVFDRFFRPAWRDYRKARERIASRR